MRINTEGDHYRAEEDRRDRGECIYMNSGQNQINAVKTYTENKNIQLCCFKYKYINFQSGGCGTVFSVSLLLFTENSHWQNLCIVRVLVFIFSKLRWKSGRIFMWQLQIKCYHCWIFSLSLFNYRNHVVCKISTWWTPSRHPWSKMTSCFMSPQFKF